MEVSISKIKCLEDEVKALRDENDRFRQLAINAENETANRRAAYLALQNDYEIERRKRVNLELRLIDAESKGNINETGELGLEDAAVDEEVSSHSLVVEENSSERFQSFNNVAVEEISSGEVRSMTSLTNPLHEAQTAPASSKPSTHLVPESFKKNLAKSKVQMNQSSLSKRKFNDEDPNLIQRKKTKIDSGNDKTNTGTRESFFTTKMEANTTPELVSSRGSDSLAIEALSSSYGLSEDKKLVKVSLKSEAGSVFSPTGVSKHLGGASYFQIQPAPLPVQVSRKALTDAYGLPGTGSLWRSKYNHHRFMIPQLAANPEMPRSPGQPGLLLSVREETCQNGQWTLFIRAEGNKARMNYAGEYSCQTVAKMTKEEFATQQSGVKLAWGKKVTTSIRPPIYCELRARITLRKKFRTEPTKAEVEAEALLIKANDYASSITDIDVVEAFERGEEKFNILKLECVSYSHQQAKDYIKAQTSYNQRERDRALADSLMPPEKHRMRLRSKSKGKKISARTEVEALGSGDEVDSVGPSKRLLSSQGVERDVDFADSPIPPEKHQMTLRSKSKSAARTRFEALDSDEEVDEEAYDEEDDEVDDEVDELVESEHESISHSIGISKRLRLSRDVRRRRTEIATIAIGSGAACVLQ